MHLFSKAICNCVVVRIIYSNNNTVTNGLVKYHKTINGNTCTSIEVIRFKSHLSEDDIMADITGACNNGKLSIWCNACHIQNFGFEEVVVASQYTQRGMTPTMRVFKSLV